MKNKIENIITSYLQPGQVLLEIKEYPQGDFVRIIIDSKESITLEDTAHLTRKIRNSTEFESTFPNDSRLEVSTPGSGYSLEHPFQYMKNINRELKVVYEKNGHSITIKGKVMDANEHTVKLKMKNDEVSLLYGEIKKAIVTFSFK